MTKGIWVILAIPIMTIALFGASISSMQAEATPAVLIRFDAICAVFNGDGDLVDAPCSFHLVTTNSAKDTFIVKVHAYSTPASDGKAKKFNFANTDSICGFIDANGDSRDTTDWQEIISAAGEVNAICKFKS